jgi:hypothetical protein
MPQFYFGTQQRMIWAECPSINVDISSKGWSSQNNYLNGGAGLTTSNVGHKEYQFNWNLTSADNIYSVVDYYSGIYGTGPLYFLDPFSTRSNVLPKYFAAPGITTLGGAPGLLPFSAGVNPSTVTTPANSYGLPLTGAGYPSGAASLIQWIPVPQGYSVGIGVFGSGAPLQYKWDTGSLTNITYLNPATSSPVIMNTLLAPGASDSGIGLYTPSGSAFTVYGIIVQIRQGSVPATAFPTSVTNTGKWISGRGHSGCQFNAEPTITGYSSAMDKVGASATLVEVGAWQR